MYDNIYKTLQRNDFSDNIFLITTIFSKEDNYLIFQIRLFILSAIGSYVCIYLNMRSK